MSPHSTSVVLTRPRTPERRAPGAVLPRADHRPRAVTHCYTVPLHTVTQCRRGLIIDPEHDGLMDALEEAQRAAASHKLDIVRRGNEVRAAAGASTRPRAAASASTRPHRSPRSRAMLHRCRRQGPEPLVKWRPAGAGIGSRRLSGRREAGQGGRLVGLAAAVNRPATSE